MIPLLIWVVLVIVACYVLAVVAILPLLYFVSLHHFRFGVPPRELVYRDADQLTDLQPELESNTITLNPDDYWEVR